MREWSILNMEKNTLKTNINVNMCNRCFITFIKRMKNVNDMRNKMRVKREKEK